MGVSKATNYGLKKSFTKFLGFQSADDVSFENRIEKQMNVLLNNNEIDICGTGMIESNREIVPFFGSFDDFRKNMYSSPLIVGGSFVGKKEIFEKVNYFNEAGANFYNIKEPLCIWFHDYSTFKN